MYPVILKYWLKLLSTKNIVPESRSEESFTLLNAKVQGLVLSGVGL